MKIKLDPGAKMPTRAHPADAGLDLYAMDSCEIPGFGSTAFDTGVHIAIPPSFAGFVKSKSGLMMEHNIVTDGLVDSGYTGSIRVKLFNHSGETVWIEKGQKIAQLVIVPVCLVSLEEVADIPKTDRGDAGFGSTGKY